MNSIEEMTLVGIGQRMFKVFDLPTMPIEMPTNDRVHLLNTLAQRQGQKLEYPIMAFSLTNVEPSDTIPVSAALYRQIATSVRDDTIGSLAVVPVILTIGVTYVDNDRTRLLRTMAKWMFARGQGELNMRLRVDGIPVDIQVTPDDSLSAPQKDITPEQANQYEMEGSLRVRTYMSGDFGTAIKRVTRIAEFTSSALSVPADGMPIDITSRTAPVTVGMVEDTITNFSSEDLNAHLLFTVSTQVQ
jgi:hypothetical protein